ncbi:MAG: ATP-binding cassette domain-containing protein [Bacilli bacterium]|nr:ATP-binding cassette domain-containing protein [Bacilli bacterium]
MQILSVNDLSANYGFGTLFDGICFTLNEGERISIVGPNGCGKSTLLKIIAGIEKATNGQVSIKKGAKVSYLDQTGASKSDPRVVSEILKESFGDLYDISKYLKVLEDEMEKNPSDTNIVNKYCNLIEKFSQLGGYEMDAEINTVLNGLKLDTKILNQVYNDLSGGEKTLVQLAKILITKPDLLLLDEPTNHLDIERIEWLENYINNFKGASVIVSHDRYFLDKMCNKLLDLETKEGEVYNTNYSGFLEEKERNFEKQLANYKDQQQLIKKLETEMKWFAERGMQTNSSTLTARAHALQTRIDKIRDNAIVRPVKRKKTNMEFQEVSKSGKRIITVNDFSVLLPNGDILIDDISFDVTAGEHIALLGPNGCGKSTVIKSILGENSLEYIGDIEIGPSVKIGYIPQMVQFPDDKKTLLEYFRCVTGLPEQRIRQILVGFQFYNDDIKKKVGNLSGGERMKIKLAELLQNSVNALILDEPTNHIDIDTKEVFEKALDDFSGTVLFISHDRYFINKFADKIICFNNKQIQTYYGDYDYYVSKRDELVKQRKK